MRIRSFYVTGCVAALAGVVAAQSPCEEPNPPSWCPPVDPCLGDNPPADCPEPDPCMGESPPEYCGPPGGDPCMGPDPPWFCPGIGIFENPFSFVDDEETGFRFSQFKAVYSLDERRIVYRIARPEVVPEGEAWDAVIQMQAPADVGWFGLAWGGTMINNPLTVVWANCSNVVISSRWADSRAAPAAYEGASYEILERGTWVNDTHYQVTAKCTGCTSWTDPDLGKQTLKPSTVPELAWAYAVQEPATPETNLSTFAFHDAQGLFSNNLTDNGNPNFAELVSRNRVMNPPREIPTNGTCLYKKPEVSDGRITITKTETTTVTEATATVTMTITDPGVTTTATTTLTETVTAGSACGGGVAGPTVTATTTVVPTGCPTVTKVAQHHWY